MNQHYLGPDEEETVTVGKFYIESVINMTLILALVLLMVASVISTLSAIGVSINLNQDVTQTNFTESVFIIAEIIARSLVVTIILVVSGYFIAKNVASGADWHPNDAATFFMQIGLFVGVIIVVTLGGYLIDGWPAIIGAALGGISALRAIYRVYMEF